jgi:hypothetical protein
MEFRELPDGSVVWVCFDGGEHFTPAAASHGR